MAAIDPDHLVELAADLGAIQRDLDVWSANIDSELSAVQAQVANLPAATADPRVDALALSVQALEERPVPPPYDDSALAGRVVALEGHPFDQYATASDIADVVAMIPPLVAPYDDRQVRDDIVDLANRLAADEAKSDVPAYDDSDLRQLVESNRVAAADSLVDLDGRLSAVEERPDLTQAYQQTFDALAQRITVVEAEPPPAPYDDRQLRADIDTDLAAVEARIPAAYDDSGLVARIGAQETAYGTLSPRVDGAATQAYKASTSATAALNAVVAMGSQLSAAVARIASLEAAVKALQPPAPAWDPTDLAHPFAQTSAWNATVPTAATYKALGVDLSSNQFGGSPWAEGDSPLSSAPPVWIGKASDPVWSCYDPHYKTTRTFHAPDGMYPMTGPDHAAVIYDTTTGTVWSLFMWTSTDAAGRKIGLDATSGGTESCSITGTGWAVRNADGTIDKAGIRASGASVLGGLVTGDDFAKGRCDHALAIIIARGFQQPGPVDPALTQDQGAVGTYLGGTGAPHEGSWLAIPRTTTAVTGLTPEQQVIWRCLQEHGGYVVDSNKGFSFPLEPVTTTAAQLASVNSNGFMATVAKALRFVVPTATSDPYMGTGYGGPY